jgi:hypothetical protein
MPTFDGGHCFLTALLPIKTGEVFDNAGLSCSPVHMVRDALAILPTAHQSPVTCSLEVDSPFARDPRTHFARLAVIDNVIYNGRRTTSTLLDQSDRTVPQPLDELPCPYLMIVIDFDAPKGTDAELRAYLQNMWATVRADLDPVFRHCFGYLEKAHSAETFADYIIGCQLETTMPFNDYWSVPPKLPAVTGRMILGTLIGCWALVMAAVLWVFIGLNWGAEPAWSFAFIVEVAVLAVFALIPAAYVLYRLIMGRGLKPFPVAPHSDLPSILKALYLQRQLISFAIRMQGEGNATLHDEFGKFLRRHKVGDTSGPTQAAGTILFKGEDL